MIDDLLSVLAILMGFIFILMLRVAMSRAARGPKP